MRRVWQGILACLFFGAYVATGLLLVLYYEDAVAAHCRSQWKDGACAAVVHGKNCAPKDHEKDERLPSGCSVAVPGENARYFAAQTISTTGYGSEVFLHVPKVQEIATYGMLAGPLFFAFFISLVVSAVVTKSSG